MSESNTCLHVRPNGEQCQVHPLKTGVFCFFHEPDRAEERAKAVAKGGVEGRRSQLKNTMINVVLTGDVPDIKLVDERDVLLLCQLLVNFSLRGHLDPKAAQAIAGIGNIALRAMEQGQIDKRLQEIEEQLRPLQGLSIEQLTDIMRSGAAGH